MYAFYVLSYIEIKGLYPSNILIACQDKPPRFMLQFLIHVVMNPEHDSLKISHQ